MKCHFCDRRAVNGPCRWPVEVFEPATYADLVVDDLVRRWSKKLDHRPPAKVWSIKPVETIPGMLSVALAIGRGGYRLKGFVVLAASRVRVLRMAYCNVDTCERHQRELGQKVIWCQDHWRTWEQVA